MVRHVAFSLIAFIVLQRLRLCPEETLGEVKDRLQREVMSGGTPPPPVKGRVAATQLVSAQVLIVKEQQPAGGLRDARR
jgi:hypothetical protein